MAPPTKRELRPDQRRAADSRESTPGLGYGTLYARGGGFRPQRLVQVEGAQLDLVLSRPPFGEYLRRLWARRHFILVDAKARVDAGTRANLLGKAWLIINPILDATVYFLVFGLLLNSSRGIPNFIGYLVIGVFLFQWTTKCLNQGARAITSGRTLIRSFAFPRASLPIATVTRATITFGPTLATMIILVVLIPWLMPVLNPSGEPIEPHMTWRWFLVPFVLVLQLAMNMGLALLTARICARIPDLTQLIGVFTRFWLYTSAVFFSISRFDGVPWLQTLMQLNPMYIVLDMVRDCLLYGVTPSWSSWVLLTVWSGGLLIAGSLIFWLGEESYGTA